jgi:hypothetical protein
MLLVLLVTEGDAPAAGAPPSELRRNANSTSLAVKGYPFLVLGAQCDIWRSTLQDARTLAFLDGYQEMNATTVSVGIPWSKIEPEEGKYDFSFMDWFIKQSEVRGLRLVLNLFNSNVCGKVEEVSGGGAYPQYAPTYILSDPGKYRRMRLPGPYKYVAGGPPLCPNDPNTLERERLLVARVAEHLKAQDRRGTVVMLQIDNEFYYQQWEGERPKDERAVRCLCAACEVEWAKGGYSCGEDFMFRSFARYAKTLTDTVARVYDLPVYLNSPWWDPAVVSIFLETCPNLDLVGIDGVFDPQEPNMLSRSQVGRNIPFAAENPTENPKTRLNLDTLPYYTVLGRMGIGNLLWECGPPHTVVEDPVARKRYGDALYPLKNAMAPIARARGTERLLGWYALRDVVQETTTDVFGNLVPSKPEGSIAEKARLFLREGTWSRVQEGTSLETRLGKVPVAVTDSSAGVIIRTGEREMVVAVPHGTVTLTLPGRATAEEGRFQGDHWRAESPFNLRAEGRRYTLSFTGPKVVKVTWRSGG